MAKNIGLKAQGRQNYAGANIPDLDGLMAQIGGKAEGDSYCTMCGEKGHKATAHTGGKAMVRDCSTAGEPEEGESGPKGEALTQRKATGDRDFSDSKYTTGSKNYELPGERTGKTIRIFG